MADVMEHVAYLSQEIGPRPAGTEEEQQAALYITECMQKDAGLSAVIEDFTGVANPEVPRAICSAITLAFGILALALPVVALPAAIITLLSAALYAAEAFDKPVLLRLFSRGVSQNVVARYEPGYSPESGGSRRRKIILVAHYDSGKARPELVGPVVSALPILKWVVLGAFIAVAVLLLLGTTVLLHVSGAVDMILTVLTIIALVIAALPLIQWILHKTASYNDGANCNASGVGVLMDVATRVGRGRTDMSSVDPFSEGATIHGQRAAEEAGVIPDGAEVTYEAKASAQPAENASPAERLAAAKAAVAALSGKPVSDFMSEEVLEEMAGGHKPAAASPETQEDIHEGMETFTAEEVRQAAQDAQEGQQPQDAAQQVESAQPQAEEPAAEDQDDSGLPAWFVSAQRKAKKSDDDKPVQRSRYADALDAAVSESSAFFEEANNAVISNAQSRLVSQSDGIVEVKAPASAWMQAHPATSDAQAPAQQSSAAPAAQPRSEQQAPTASQSQGAPAPQPAVAPAQQPAATPAPEAAASQRPAVFETILPDDLSVPAVEEGEGVKLPSFLTEHPKPAPVVERTADRIEVSADELGEAAPANDQLGDTQYFAPIFVDAVTAGTDKAAIDTLNAAAEGQPSDRRSIKLPSIGAGDIPAISLEGSKQRAPLADGVATPTASGKGRLSALPSIDPAHPADEAHHNPTADQLRSSLPSLSGVLPRAEEPSSAVSLTGSFAPLGATTAMAPVGDELLEDVDPDEVYIDDADDSDYDGAYTETGAYAGPSYVDMPKSRVGRLFGRFHRKDKTEETSTREWLDVDESFEARSVGAARGGWESFRDEQDAAPAARRGADDSYEDEFADDEDDFLDDEYQPSRRDGGRNWYGGAFSRVRMGRPNLHSGEEEELAPDADVPAIPQPEAPEMQKIYQFRNPDIDTEVWFVALGAELAGHGGMQAFINEHGQDLRGSIIIELEALGAGDLCVIEEEGGYQVAKTSSRMRRYTKKASQATGEHVGSASMLWKSSASSFAIKHGLQAMHLVGLDGRKPAAFGQRDDSAHGIDEELLERRADFVMELLKSI